MIFAASLLIFYSFTIEQRRMIGDEAGHDPGSRALPLGSGLIMLIAGLYDLRKQLGTVNTPRTQPVSGILPGSGKVNGATWALFWGTLLGSILYLFLLKSVGFLILTTLFLYLLFFFYGWEAEKRKGKEESTQEAQREGEKRNEGDNSTEAEPESIPLSDTRAVFGGGGMIKGGILACILVALCYGGGRIVSRELFYWGRSMGSALLASRTVSVLVFLLISACIYSGALFLSRKTYFWKVRTVGWGVSLSVGTALVLFIVFRMIFRVALPLGILDL